MKKFFSGFLISIVAGVLVCSPSFALTCDDISNVKSQKCVPTSILGDEYDKKGNIVSKPTDNTVHCKCDDGKGSSIFSTLNLVVNIMTIGIGALGVLGITIVGIQYLTAGGNEEQTRKAKRRMFEIVIGLVAYVLVYALLDWLIPDFKPVFGS